MGKIESVMKSEIIRLAKREVRTTCGKMARDVRQMKRTVSQLRKTVAALEKAAAAYGRQMCAQQSELKASEEEVKAARISGGLIRKLRKRLGISQEELGRLVGTSAVSVGLWETRNTRPSEKYRAAIVALRKLGRRDVKGLLAEKGGEDPPKAAAAPTPVSRIKDLRKRLDLTQVQLALLMGVSDTAVGFWESGKTRPSKEKQSKLAALRKLDSKEVARLLARKATVRQ